MIDEQMKDYASGSRSHLKDVFSSFDRKARIKSKLLFSSPLPSKLLYTRAFTFYFTSAGVPGLTSFRKATDPEDTRDSTDIEVII